MKQTTKPLKILCLTPANELMKTPETYFAELMSMRGHEVHLQYTGYDTTKTVIDRRIFNFNPDVIWCMMEYSLPTAVMYKELTNKPLYGHVECIPPWRTGVDNAEEWGFDYEDVVVHANNNTPSIKGMYKDLIALFNQCDYKTISGNSWRYTFEKFTGEPLDAHARYYTFNTTDLVKYYYDCVLEKKQICTIARFTPLKRVHHIIQALSLIDKEIRPKYVVVGYGQDQPYLEQLATQLDVDVDFVGSGNKGVKNKILQESMFAVQIASGIPILEAGFYSTHVIGYDYPHIKEVFGDMCTWVPNNDIGALASAIEYYVRNPKLVTELGIKSNKIMFSGEFNVYTNEQFVERVEQDIQKTITKCNEVKNGK